jgi:hypothetical protein
MAFEAKLICAVDDPTAFWPESHDMTDELKAFEALVRADERLRLQPKKIEAVRENDYCKGDERYYANE